MAHWHVYTYIMCLFMMMELAHSIFGCVNTQVGHCKNKKKMAIRYGKRVNLALDRPFVAPHTDANGIFCVLQWPAACSSSSFNNLRNKLWHAVRCHIARQAGGPTSGGSGTQKLLLSTPYYFELGKCECGGWEERRRKWDLMKRQGREE